MWRPSPAFSEKFFGRRLLLSFCFFLNRIFTNRSPSTFELTNFPQICLSTIFFTESRQLFTHELHRNEKTNQQNQKKNNVFSTDFPVPTSADRRSPFRRFAIFLIQFYRVFLKFFFTEFDLGVTEFPPRSSFALRVSPQFSADNTFFFFLNFVSLDGFGPWRRIEPAEFHRLSLSLSLSFFLSFFLQWVGWKTAKKKEKTEKKTSSISLDCFSSVANGRVQYGVEFPRVFGRIFFSRQNNKIDRLFFVFKIMSSLQLRLAAERRFVV